jgi:hypothetical protein
MHQSRLNGFVIDCQATTPDDAARFWSAALGMPSAGDDGRGYARLEAGARDLSVEVQRVDHPSRVHLDIETDDIEAEVRRLEALGARRVAQVRTWWVLEAPTGHRFCVVKPPWSLDGKPGTTRWP